MGIACKLKCGHCTYRSNVFLGIGFSYCYISSLLPVMKKEDDRQRAASFIHEDSAVHTACDVIYVCEQCGYLHNDLYLKIRSDTDQFELCHVCPRCAEPLTSEPLEELYPEATVLACPECRKEKLEIEAYMDWD
ncbi:hypothetical protein M3650_04355 [Paenibacillus sp. MER TA 81-3]|nr:hypothetical protein [Paenibacillus sp. MER TA 81-3]